MDPPLIYIETIAMINAFISFRSEDRGIAEYLGVKLRDLSDSQVNPFICTEIAGGVEWKKAIQEALQDSSILILLYTLPEADWIWCMFEAAFFSGISSGRPRGQQGHLICLASPFAAVPPPPLADLQSYKADKEGIEQFLSDLLARGKFTSGNAIVREFKIKKAKAIEEVSTLLSDHMNLETKTIDYFADRITVTATDPGEKDPSLFMNKCTVQGSAVTMAILGMNRESVKWPELRSSLVLQKNMSWIQELEFRLRSMVGTSSTEQPSLTGLMSPFHAGLRRFLPVLARVERVRNLPAQVSVIFIELSDIPQDEFGLEVRLVPPTQAALIRLLNLARSFRWDVINPLLNLSERYMINAKGKNPQMDQQWKEAYEEYRKKLERMSQEGKKHNFEDPQYVQAIFELENDSLIRELWSKSHLADESIKSAVQDNNFDGAVFGLREFQRLNKMFIILCLKRYLKEAENLRPKELTMAEIERALIGGE